ncbi:MAG: hypothetical protein A3F84_21435 [Candidatus Handelsmanbacteria bacterium RIFCSPLOWO2_12_FULL_64_10]|uniref:Histidinol-phosphatase n=1 Tax=Handelsmanbacteria sp. (strain RIFCSPLOWO2_12_FULL_64_10) TaxID=1817868 RepID=A0A1F6CBJ0_HANXR|nr:MAG: hypothetical protein A3F84_21435 [Candidatus Handelsmanbacteria bacterium RIFCSPLOWO2_12_FULL_64_10]
MSAARAAGRLQLAQFRRGVAVEMKTDGTPVTQVDRDSEALIRAALERTTPGFDFLGEESAPGGKVGPHASGSRWIVDPLDGTKKFVRGLPFFGPCIALERNGELVLGVMHVPAMNETIWAERGAGAFLNGEPARVSYESSFERASIVWHNDQEFHERGWASSLDPLRAAHYNPGFLDLYTYLCLAMGRIDGVLMLGESPWDVAAAQVIIEEAGGQLTDFKGDRTVYQGQTVATNGLLQTVLLDVVKGCR